MITDYATYCPEDNKLRLYVGRVPRADYERLRAEGWTSTPKQDCDFVATWTPTRRDTAIEFGEVILDEDQSPEDRAADRAERFGGYLDKRLDEAGGHADAYDGQPLAHGFQSQQRADKAAARHDRIADKACDAWSKAEYWQRRTAGVISHALYGSRPDVRMGRIKVLEADLRRFEASPEHYPNWITHTRLRLAYENQMLEAQGGRAAFVEMEIGGWVGDHQIRKVNRSNATGRVVSVTVAIVSNCDRWGNKLENGPKTRLVVITTERMGANIYRAPSEEDKAALLAQRKAEKAAAPAKEPCPLVNPTEAEAEKLQALWNERAKAQYEEADIRRYGKVYGEFKPGAVVRIKQAVYSAVSKGAYARAETRGLRRDAHLAPQFSNMWCAETAKRDKEQGPAVCQLRTTSGGTDQWPYVRSVIILTDKPQKPFPAAVWQPIAEKVEVPA